MELTHLNNSDDCSPVLSSGKLFTHRNILFLILLFALGIRCYGISRDLPFIFAGDVVWGIFEMPRDLIKKIFLFQNVTLSDFILPPAKYPPGFKYILFVGFFIVNLVTVLYMQIVQGIPFSVAGPKATKLLFNNGGFVVTGRLLAVLFALLTIYLLYYLGKELFNREVGLVAALFLAVMPNHVNISHFMRVDTTLLFGIVLLALLAYKMASTGDLKYYMTAGLCFGALNSIKPSAPLFLLFLIHAHLLRIRKEKGKWINILWDKRLLYLAVMSLVGILITFPTLFTNFQLFKYYAFTRARYRSITFQGINLADTSGMFNLLLGYFPMLFGKLGILFTLCGFIGTIVMLFHKNKLSQIIIATPLIYFAYLSIYSLKILRWIIPVYPFMALWAAFLYYQALQKSGSIIKNKQIQKAIGTIALIMLIAKPLSTSIKDIADITRPDSRVIGRKWVLENIPKGSVIATYIHHSWSIPPLNYEDSRYRLVDVPYKYYNIAGAMTKDRALPLDHYKQEGVQYFILSTEKQNFHFTPFIMEKFPEAAKSFQDFYKEMETNSELVYMMDPKSGNYKGPGYKIYRLRND